jgi:hypothetical protein
MAPKHRLPHPFHFEQPFALGSAQESVVSGPVVGAIVAGPLGILVQRAFQDAFTAVARASAAQKLAAAAAVTTSSLPKAKPAAKRRKPARKRPAGSDPQ